MPKSDLPDRTTRAKTLVRAAKEARESFRATPIGSLERKSLALRAISSLFVAQDAAIALRAYSDKEIADLVSQIKIRAQAGTPLRYKGDPEHTDLLHAGWIYLCWDGSLDVPGGPLALADSIPSI